MAPKAMKRPAAASAGGRPSKKAAHDPVVAQCSSVAEALRSAPGLTAELRGLLVDIVPTSLGVCKDARHDFQHRAVKMIEEALIGIQGSLKSDVQEAQAPVDRSSQDKAERAASLQAAEAELSDLSARVVEARAAMDSSNATLKAAKATLAAAQTAQEKGDAALTDALGKKTRLEEVHQQTFARVKEEGCAKKTDLSLLTKVGKEFNFDPSLLASMGTALEKEAGSRGPFDVVILDKLGAAFSVEIEGFDQILKEGEPGKVERAAAVSSAEASLSEAAAALEASKARLADAVAQEKGGKGKRKAADTALASYMTDMKKSMDAFDEAQRRLADFERGPWAALMALKELAPPADAEEKAQAVPEETAQEKDDPAHVVDETAASTQAL